MTPPPWPRTPPTTRSTCWPTTPTPTPATTLTITAVTQPANGTVAITGGGAGLTYTPDANFTGTDTFTYTVSDGAFGTDTATVSVTVTAVNDAPTAEDFAGTVAEDSTNIPVDLTTLTDDVDGDALTYTITTPLAHGTLTPTGTAGLYTYTPNANFTGPDSFTYTVNDGTGGPATPATVSVTVTAVNDAPVAVDDTVHQTEDTAAEFPGHRPERQRHRRRRHHPHRHRGVQPDRRHRRRWPAAPSPSPPPPTSPAPPASTTPSPTAP